MPGELSTVQQQGMALGASAHPAALALHRLEEKSGSGWAWKITEDTCCPHWSLNFMKDDKFLLMCNFHSSVAPWPS